jgi:hypothetical protein
MSIAPATPTFIKLSKYFNPNILIFPAKWINQIPIPIYKNHPPFEIYDKNPLFPAGA